MTCSLVAREYAVKQLIMLDNSLVSWMMGKPQEIDP